MERKHGMVALLVGLAFLSVNGAAEDAWILEEEDVATVSSGTSRLQADAAGVLVPRRFSVVASGAEGLVREVLVSAGDRVSAGQPLARLDGRAAELELSAAQATYESLQAQVKLMERGDPESASILQRGDLQVQRALLEQLELDLTARTIRAPFAGQIGAVHVEVGEWVSRGGAVADLLDLDPPGVVVAVPDHIAVRLEVEAPAQVRLDAYPDTALSAVVKRIVPATAPDSDNLVHVTLALETPLPDLRLLGGMGGTARLASGIFSGFLVPASGLTQSSASVASVCLLRPVAGSEGRFRVESIQVLVLSSRVEPPEGGSEPLALVLGGSLAGGEKVVCLGDMGQVLAGQEVEVRSRLSGEEDE